VLELPGCYTEGQSVASVAAKLDREVEDWLDHAKREGIPIPKPRSAEECSGRLVLRLPRHLHTRAALLAEREGISLNQFILSAVAELVGAQAFAASLRDRLVQGVELKATSSTLSVEPRSNAFLYGAGFAKGETLAGQQIQIKDLRSSRARPGGEEKCQRLSN
jgi:predicted HicB family RNase H-like nuclease